MRQCLRDTAVGLGATAALVAWLVGVPLLLWTWRHNPFPTAIPAWDRLTTLVDGGYLDPHVIPNTVAVTAWAAWAWVTRTIGLDTSARLHHRPAPVAEPGRLQLAVGRWVSAVTRVAVLFTQRPTPVQAGGPPPLYAYTAAAHTVGLDAEAAPSAVVTRPSPSPPPAPAAATAPAVVYVVQRGDSYWRIAEQHRGSGGRWRELRDANIGQHRVDGSVITADSKLIHPGDHLHLPPGWTTTATTPPAEPSPAAPLAAPPGVHVVGDGENLSRIAADRLSDPNRWPEIYDLNRDQIRQPNLIYTGQQLRLPQPEPPPVDAPSAETAPPSIAAPSAPGQPGPPPAPPLPTVPSLAPEAQAAAAVPTPTPAVPAVSPPASSQSRQQPASGQTGADRPSESTVPLVPLMATVGAVTAGAVVWQTRRRRAFALLRRRPHHPLPTPSTSARHVEGILVNLADTDTVDWLDATQRALRTRLAGTNHPGRIIALRAGTHGVEILWTEPPPSIEPWISDHTGTWRLPAEVTLDDLRAVGHDHGPLAPAMVTLGDTIDGPLLVDLETAGTLIIDAPPDQAHDVLAAITVDLATSPWAANLDLRVLGGPQALIGLDRVEAIDAEDIDGPLAAHAATANPNGDTPYRSRLADHDEDREPTVVVAFDPVDLGPLTGHLGPGSPAGIVALVTAASVAPHTGLILSVFPDGSGRLTPPGLDLTQVTSTDLATQAAIVELVAQPIPEDLDHPTATLASDQPTDTEPGRAHAQGLNASLDEVIDSILHTRPIEVRVLTGTPTVSGWRTPPTGQIATELVVFFATRTRAITPAAARSTFYPDGITSEAWRAALSRTRRSLGTDPTTGRDHLPAADTGRLAVGDSVGCDWTRFQTLRQAAPAHGTKDRARLLSAALKLIDGTPFSTVPPRRYRWVDHPNDYLRQQITVAIHDTASDLAELALSNLDNPTLALAAIRAGLLGGGDNEHLHRLAIRAHLAHRDPAAADAVIRHLEQTIQRHDGLNDLQPETLQLVAQRTARTSDEFEAPSALGVG